MRGYSKEQLREAVDGSKSYAGVLRFLSIRQSGGSQSNIKRRIASFNIDVSHFTGQACNKGKISNNRLYASDLLVRLPEGSHRTHAAKLKRGLLEQGRPYVCAGTGCLVGEVWLSQPLTLHIDHIDGDFLNNLEENLRFLCPNCHAQTATFGNKRR